MTQDPPADPPAQSVSPQPGPPAADATLGRISRPLPSWLPYLAVAVVPALVVGLLVYAFAGGGSRDSTAGIIEGLITGGDTEGTATYVGDLPPGFPPDFPVYKGAEVTAAYLLTSPDSVRYYIILSSDDSVDQVYGYYLSALDLEPWQVQVARSSAEFTGMRFSRPDDPDVDGGIGVHHSGVHDRTSVYITVDRITASSESLLPEQPFKLGASRPLPANFPEDIPIYKGRGNSTVLATQVGRGSGINNFVISFVTRDSQAEVLSFYRQEFEKRGWTVTDSQAADITSFAIGIDFSDGARQEISGSISADTFEDDANYTRIDLALDDSARRGRGN